MARSPLTFPFGPVGKKLKMLLKKIKNSFRTPAQIFQGTGFKKIKCLFYANRQAGPDRWDILMIFVP